MFAFKLIWFHRVAHVFLSFNYSILNFVYLVDNDFFIFHLLV